MGYQEIKLELPDIPKQKLKFLFLGHLLLISWATLGHWGEQVSFLLLISQNLNLFFPGQSHPQPDVLKLFCLEYCSSSE